MGKYIERCNMCQRMKNRTEAPAEKLKLSEIPKKLWTYLIVDFITKLPLIARKDAILVVYNKLFKITHFVTITEGLVKLFRNNVWKLHGLPESVVLDREPQFTTELTKKLNWMLGIETKLSMTFHLQTNGQTERINQELGQYLRLFIDYRQKDWLEWLVSAEFAVNNKIHSAIKISLFIVNYERKLRMGAEIRKKGTEEDEMTSRQEKERERRIEDRW